VQEKNITFSTYTKLRVKVMGRCWKLAKEENIRLRRSYRRELKKVLRVIRFSKSTWDKKKVTAAMRRVKTMANALLRDIMRKLPESSRGGCKKFCIIGQSCYPKNGRTDNGRSQRHSRRVD
jgi:hypothetical protein